MNYEISFKTIQKYCMHKRDNLNPELYKYRCRKLEMALKRDLASRCTEANCPLVKRLWGCTGNCNMFHGRDI